MSDVYDFSGAIRVWRPESVRRMPWALLFVTVFGTVLTIWWSTAKKAASRTKTKGYLEILVVGLAGAGKSTLINALTFGAKKAMVGDDPNGVTKEMDAYLFDATGQGDIERRDIAWDGPGVGDGDINIAELVGKYEIALTNRKVHCLALCIDVHNKRALLGLRILGAVIKKGIVHESGVSVWEHILLVGTKAKSGDCTKEDIRVFKTKFRAYVEKQLGAPPNSIKCAVTESVRGKDLSELYEALQAVPCKKMDFKKTDAVQLAKCLTEVTGMELFSKDEFREKLMEIRKEADKRMEALERKHFEAITFAEQKRDEALKLAEQKRDEALKLADFVKMWCEEKAYQFKAQQEQLTRQAWLQGGNLVLKAVSVLSRLS